MQELGDGMTTTHGRLLSTKRAKARASRRGTAILPALIVVVLVATLSMIYVQVSLAKNKEQRASVDSKRAFYMAEAGLAEGFNGLCLGKSGDVASESVPAVFGAGVFWTKGTELGQGRVRLVCTGLCGAGRATLSMTVERKANNIGALGFFGDQGITVQAGALIDSYDSRAGTYASQAPAALMNALAGKGAKVGGNSDITVQGTLSKPTSILGSVNPGPAGTVFRSGMAFVMGSMAPNTSTVAFPAVQVPPLPVSGDRTVTAANELLSTGTYGMRRLRVRGSLTIQGPTVVVVDELRLDPGAALAFDATNGPVRMFVVSGMKLANGSTLNTTATDPLGASIQVAGTAPLDLDGDGVLDSPVHIMSTGSFFGSIYAPGAAVSVPAGFIAYGAVVAKNLTIQTGGKLHFDRALTAGSSETTGTPQLFGWRIVEVPNVPITNLRFDALANLIRLGITPVQPKNAHWDIGVTPP